MPTTPKKESEPKQPTKAEEDKNLDEELDDTFPASDPPASTAPGHGATGAEVVKKPKS